MVRALDEAKREAQSALRKLRSSVWGWPRSSTGSVDESESSVEVTIDLLVLQIHRDADTEGLRLASQKAPSPTCMKIILATNIAESSITFVDVGIVMDFALVKVRLFELRFHESG